jgi:hypothetical protein
VLFERLSAVLEGGIMASSVSNAVRRLADGTGDWTGFIGDTIFGCEEILRSEDNPSFSMVVGRQLLPKDIMVEIRVDISSRSLCATLQNFNAKFLSTP